MKIFIDFDDSLFNTKKFHDRLIKIFLENGISKKDFFDTYYDYPQKTAYGLKKYDPEKQINTLGKKNNINEKRLRKDLKKFISNTREFVFPDVNAFLKDNKKTDLYVVSYAYTDFQFRKIINSGIYTQFRRVSVSDKNKNIVLKQFVGKKDAFIFIDDRIENINLAKKYFPNCATFLLKRKEGRYYDKKTKAVDFEIKNLKEAQKIILKLGHEY
jgi:FMN phosphatase YigB (HAD superfamily)